MSIKSRTLAGVAWLSLANSANQLISLLAFIILARTMAIADFGLVMLAVLISNIFSMFYKDGVSDFLVRSEVLTEELIATAFWVMFALSLALMAISIFAVGYPLYLVYGEDIFYYNAALSPVILFGGLSVVNMAMARREFRFKVSALRNFVNGFLTGVIAVIMALYGFGAWSLIISRVLGALGSAAILWVQEPYRPRLKFRGTGFRTMLVYSGPNLASRLIIYIASKMPELILAFITGPAALAIYRVAGRVLEVFNSLFLDSISNVLVTSFSKLPVERYQKALQKTLKLQMAVVLPMFFGLASLAEPITRLVYGVKWMDSAIVMLILSLQITPLLFRNVAVVLYKSSGRTAKLFMLSMLELVAASGFVLFAAFHGVNAVAWAIFGVSHLIAAAYAVSLNRVLGIDIKSIIQEIIPFWVTSALMAVGVYFLYDALSLSVQPLFAVLLSITAGALAYAFVNVLVFPKAVMSVYLEISSFLPGRITRRATPLMSLICRTPAE